MIFFFFKGEKLKGHRCRSQSIDVFVEEFQERLRLRKMLVGKGLKHELLFL